MKLAMLKVLSEQEVKDIHEASLDILAHCGMKILSRRMFDFLKEKGLEVDEQNQIVRFSRRCIEDALSTIPSQFEVFDPAFKLMHLYILLSAMCNGFLDFNCKDF